MYSKPWKFLFQDGIILSIVHRKDKHRFTIIFSPYVSIYIYAIHNIILYNIIPFSMPSWQNAVCKTAWSLNSCLPMLQNRHPQIRHLPHCGATPCLRRSRRRCTTWNQFPERQGRELNSLL